MKRVCWRSSPRIFFMKIVTKLCNSKHFWMTLCTIFYGIYFPFKNGVHFYCWYILFDICKEKYMIGFLLWGFVKQFIEINVNKVSRIPNEPPAPSKSATEYHFFHWQPSKDITYPVTPYRFELSLIMYVLIWFDHDVDCTQVQTKCIHICHLLCFQLTST